MKIIMKTTILFILIFTIAVCIPLLAYAASYDNSSNTASKEPEQTRSVNISTSWTTVLSSNTGFNRNVTVSATTYTYIGLISGVPCDIRLLDINDQQLWIGESSVPGNGSQTVFWCGSNVYKIQIRTTAGEGTCSAW